MIGDGDTLRRRRVELDEQRRCSGCTATWSLLRTYDERSVVYHRQGRIGTYAIYWGHEAIQAGAVVRPRRATTGSSRPTASRRSACCAGCRPRRCSPGGAGIPPAGGTRRDHSVASICVPIATQVPHAAGLAWGKKLKGERGCARRLLRRRRDLRGRVPRGRELRRRDAGAARPVLQQQRLGDLDAARRADARARRWPTRRSATGCPASASTAPTCWPSTRPPARPSRGRGPASGPTFIEAVTYRAAPHATADDPRAYIDHEPRRGGEAQHECLGRYEGYLRRARPARRRARRADPHGGALAAHARGDRRGRGRARRRPRRWSSTTPTRTRRPLARPADARRACPERHARHRPELTLVEAINDGFHTELARDDSVMVMGEDVGRAGGVFRATAGLRDRFGADRCVDTPLAEAGILGTAVGLCMAGLAAGRRDAVRRVQLPVPRPAHHARRPLPLAHRRQDGLPDHDPHALRRRGARAGAARRLARGVLRAHARA